MITDASSSAAGHDAGAPVAHAWQRGLLWLGAPLCLVGLASTGIASQWRGGRFAELILDRRIVEVVRFQTDDPAYAGEMTVRTLLAPVTEGTEVTIVCENVPRGISAADHAAGIASTLKNLAAYTE